jgi:3-mercaptopyruvate sulfurtransferase SseA
MNEGSSARAAQQLIHAGIANVKVLRGGLEGWEKAGYAVESANPAEAPPRIAATSSA